jgi:2-haloacid dehalogenase
MPTKWVTFDCFGTLVDWNTGFLTLLSPLFGARTVEVMRAYHRFERELEVAHPHRLYRDVLGDALSRAAEQVGASLSGNEARTLSHRWSSLPVFADVEDMLAALRAGNCRLAVLTNCDKDLFAQTQRAFRQPFDLVVTAEEVRAYKPSPKHFQRFAELTGVRRQDWVHVAASWYHDIAPTRDLGIPRIWLDREKTGDGAHAASARIESAADVPAVVEQLHGFGAHQ